jgi:glycosyltransferase involved in cell wall biosynthesis
VSEKDDGIYQAMNKGIKIASGDWILNLNSDDYLEATALERLNQSTLVYENKDIISGKFSIIEKDFKEIKPRFNNIKIHKGIIAPHVSSLVKKDCFFEIGLYDENLKIAADKDFFIRCYLAGKSFMFIDVLICKMSNQGTSNVDLNRVLMENHVIRIRYGMSRLSSLLFYIIEFVKVHLNRILKK